MRGTSLRSTVKSVVAILCAACFLTMSLGSVSRAVAADTWETWPKKAAEPGVETKPTPPPEPVGAAKEGKDRGTDVEKKSSSGNLGWWAAGAAAAVGIAIAVGSGGGGGGTTSGH